MSENIQPTSEENKIVESLKKDNLSKNPSGVNVEQPTINLEQNRFECRSCGYIYDPLEGNKKLNIPKNTPFSELDGNTFACPVCSCLLYTSPSPRDEQSSRMPSSA